MERAFVYGDLVFESMRFEAGQIPFISYHLDRLKAAAKCLKMEFPNQLNETAVLEQANQLIQNADESFKIRLVLYRDASGFYLPNQNQAKWELAIFPLSQREKPMPIKMGIYTDIQKQYNQLSSFKTGNALLYVMASIWAKENGFDDAFIINEQGRVCEATSSNFCWFDGTNWFTPPLTEACVAGIGRRILLENEQVIEKICYLNDLKAAQKIYLTNAIHLQTAAVLVE